MFVLITGGAGFIGSHTADLLLKRGYKVRILDNLSPKTHFRKWPNYLNPKFEKIKGDVRLRKDLEEALTGVDYVIHLAAEMDLMPQFSIFFDTNVTSTALLYEIIVEKNLPIKKILVASSQFVYGEGHWYCPKDGDVFPKMRTLEHLEQKIFDPPCPVCSGKIKPQTNLETHQDPPNQYAISKYTQELITLKLGRLYSIPSVSMRYSIVHGPRQSLHSFYSGALRIFTLQMLHNLPLTIYEDGQSLRDFVSVYDVANANALVLESDKADFQNFNVGGGKAYRVLDLVKIIAKVLNKKVDLTPCGEFRVGDIRHAISDITKLEKLGFRPEFSEERIVKEYIEWVLQQKLDKDYLKRASKEMKMLGIIRQVS